MTVQLFLARRDLSLSSKLGAGAEQGSQGGAGAKQPKLGPPAKRAFRRSRSLGLSAEAHGSQHGAETTGAAAGALQLAQPPPEWIGAFSPHPAGTTSPPAPKAADSNNKVAFMLDTYLGPENRPARAGNRLAVGIDSSDEMT